MFYPHQFTSLTSLYGVPYQSIWCPLPACVVSTSQYGVPYQPMWCLPVYTVSLTSPYSVPYLSVVKLSIYIYLSFSDIAGQVWDRMSDIVVGHRQDWDLSDGAISPFYTTSSLNTSTHDRV